MWSFLKRLLRFPGFLLLSVLVYAVSSGAATTMFGLVDTVVWQTPPFTSPSNLLYIYGQQEGVTVGLPYDDYLLLRDNQKVFEQVLARCPDKARIGTEGSVDRLDGEMVSPNFFAVLGVRAVLGHTFADNGAEPVSETRVVIGYDYWQRRFGGDRSVLGRKLRISPDRFGATADRGRDYTVIGVMPIGFSGLSPGWKPAEFWVPVAARTPDYECIWPARQVGSFVVVGRLRRGTSKAAALPVLEGVGEQLRSARHSEPELRWKFIIRDQRYANLPFDGSVHIDPGGLALALLAVATALILIGGSSLAGVLMARQFLRRHEIAIRLALGARPLRIGATIMGEAVALACIGAPLGLLASRGCLRLLIRTIPYSPGWSGDSARVATQLDVKAIFCSLAVGILTAVVVSVGPALAMARTRHLQARTNDTGIVPHALVTRFRYWIAVPQVCLSLALLAVGGEGIANMVREYRATRGYDAKGVVFARVSLPPLPRCMLNAGRLEEHLARWERMSYAAGEAGASVPNAISAVATVGPTERSNEFVTSREAWASGREPRLVFGAGVSVDYFAVLRIPIIAGRVFDERDRAADANVAIVSRSLAQLMWPGQNPLGRYIANHERGAISTPRWLEVIGVVADANVGTPGSAANPMLYRLARPDTRASIVLVRGQTGSGVTLRRLLAKLRDAVPDLDVTGSGTVEDSVNAVLYPVRFATVLLLVSGAVGCMLSCIALFGATRQTVTIRLQELGLRIALGAKGRDVTTLVLKDGCKVLLIGAAAGLCLGFAVWRLISRLVVPLPLADIRIVAAVPVIVSIIVLVACYLAARRAGHTDPATVLREG